MVLGFKFDASVKRRHMSPFLETTLEMKAKNSKRGQGRAIRVGSLHNSRSFARSPIPLQLSKRTISQIEEADFVTEEQ